jgi:hypothetical protein
MVGSPPFFFLIENSSEQDGHQHRNKSPKKGVFCFWFENIWGRVGTFCMHTVIMPVL